MELARIAARTSRLTGRRQTLPVVDAGVSGSEAHVAALLGWVQVHDTFVSVRISSQPMSICAAALPDAEAALLETGCPVIGNVDSQH